MAELHGSCLCGDVRFETAALPTGASVCHCRKCRKCRKLSGHTWASAQIPKMELSISGTVKWVGASAGAERGFCPRCGSFLFRHAHDEDMISATLGAVDGPTGLRQERHIFVAGKGDFHDIAGGLPQEAQ